MRIFVRFDIFEILFFKELFRVFAVKKNEGKKFKKEKNRSFWSRETEFGRKRGTHYSASILRLRRELLFFLSLFLSLKTGISLSLLCFSLLLLRAFRRAL